MNNTALTIREWALLLVLCGALFLEGLDVSMISVALPSIRADLDVSTSTLQWVVSAYVLGYGGFLILGGRAADLFGRRRMFLSWLAVFAMFSGLGGLATEAWMLLISRFCTGVSAAFLAPAGLSIITTTFREGPVRNMAVLVYAATGAAGFSFGLVAGGVLTEADWRLVFFVPVVIATAILLLGMRLLPAAIVPTGARTRLDIPGALTLTSAMLVLVYGVVNAPEAGWFSWQTWALLLLSAGVFTVFFAIEKRSAVPLIRFGIFRSGPLVRANLGAMSLTGSFLGFQFITVLYLQQLRGWSPMETGIALVPLGADSILAWALTPRLVNRFGLTPVTAAGLLLGALAMLQFMRIDTGSSYVTVILPTLLLSGTAFALAYGTLTIAATNGVEAHEQGLASALVNTSFQFGAALGLAIVTAVITANSDGPSDVTLGGLKASLVVPVLILLTGAAAVASGWLRRPIGTRSARPG